MRQDVSLPYYETTQLITRNSDKYFEDINTVLFDKGQKIKGINLERIF